MVRGSTDNIMDDVERAVDDAINTYKALTRDPRFVPGAGATEIELAKQLATYGEVKEILLGKLLGMIVLILFLFILVDLSRNGAVLHQGIC